MEPLHPYREKIEHAKVKNATSDHMYCALAGMTAKKRDSKVHSDGSFKTKNRSKNALQHGFDATLSTCVGVAVNEMA